MRKCMVLVFCLVFLLITGCGVGSQNRQEDSEPLIISQAFLDDAEVIINNLRKLYFYGDREDPFVEVYADYRKFNDKYEVNWAIGKTEHLLLMCIQDIYKAYRGYHYSPSPELIEEWEELIESYFELIDDILEDAEVI